MAMAQRPSQQLSKAAPPFLLYQDPSNKEPGFEEGMASVVKLLKGRKNIIVLVGAGISVSCGIPDFRTRGSGLYSTLDTEELGLSCAEELFDASFFQEDPGPFYKFARNLYFPLGNNERVRPSDSHKLLALLEQKKMLLRVYTQNIDGLEEEAGVSPRKIVYAHGSLQWATCSKCGRKVARKEIEQNILDGTVARCQASSCDKGSNSPAVPPPRASREPSSRASRKRTQSDVTSNDSDSDASVCGGVLKPAVTFFGEALNDNVRRCLESDRNKVDALVVIGTSLSVAPISKVIGWLPPTIPRILINRTVVRPAISHDEKNDDDDEKDFRENYVFDAYLLGFCDDVTRALGRKLFPTTGNPPPKELAFEEGKLLASLKEGDEDFFLSEWESSGVPSERILLFPGALPPYVDSTSDEVSYCEVAHCDGCSSRIVDKVQKCLVCFDYDLCENCFPVLSKTHYGGRHQFRSEPLRSC